MSSRKVSNIRHIKNIKYLSVIIFVVLCFAIFSISVLSANPGTVLDFQKISDTQGGFTGILNDSDSFGRSVSSIGDLDSDGVNDIVVGALKDDDGGPDRGAVWVLFLNSDGSVKSYQKISDLEGGFTGILDDYDNFGSSVSSIGDLDGDGIPDLVVGAYLDDDGGADRGAVWVLFLNSDGTVKSYQKISDLEGGFTGILDDSDYFGSSVSGIGDLDGDGVMDIVVGTYGDDDGGNARGAVWVLFLNSNGSVKSYQKISDTQGGFTGILNDSDMFGWSVSDIGDLDGDGVTDIVVGTPNDDDGGTNRGSVWVLFLNSNGSIKSYQKISDTQGDFTGILDDWDRFGWSVSSIGDLDGDGVMDIVVGTYGDDDGGNARGAVWVLFLNNGSVKSYQKISDTQGGFTGILNDSDSFGGSVSSIGDLDGDGVMDIVVGAYLDDDGGADLSANRGSVWVLFLNGSKPVQLPVYNEFYGKGETTNFSEVSDLTNVANPVLENEYVKIEFVGSNFNVAGKNLSALVKGKSNFVSVDSENLPSFNKTANITLKTKSYPSLYAYEILRNGQPCSAPDCVKLESNPVKFKVSHFSNYTTNGTGIVPEFNSSLIILLLVFTVLLVVIHKAKK